jgi:hypothetical protein
MAIRAQIQAGACGLQTIVHAASADGLSVTLQVESNCPKVRAMGTALSSLNALDEVLRGALADTTPVRLAGEHGLHTSCPVPIGVLKAVEAAARLALPARCEILLEQTD